MKYSLYLQYRAIFISNTKSFQYRNFICSFNHGWISPAGINISFFLTAEPSHTLLCGIIDIRTRCINWHLVSIHGVLLMTSMYGKGAPSGNRKTFIHNFLLKKQRVEKLISKVAELRFIRFIGSNSMIPRSF